MNQDDVDGSVLQRMTYLKIRDIQEEISKMAQSNSILNIPNGSTTASGSCGSGSSNVFTVPTTPTDYPDLTVSSIHKWTDEQTKKFGPVVYRKQSLQRRLLHRKPKIYYWDDALEIDAGVRYGRSSYGGERLPAQVYAAFKEWEKGNYPKWVDRTKLCEKRLENL